MSTGLRRRIAGQRHERATPPPAGDGLEGDPCILRQVSENAGHAGVELQLDEAMSDSMPHADASFDCVLSSLFFHHLDRAGKNATLREIQRVLKPGGRLLMADRRKAANPLMRMKFLLAQLRDGIENAADNVAGRLPPSVSDSGFGGVRDVASFSTPRGTLTIHGATRARESRTLGKRWQ